MDCEICINFVYARAAGSSSLVKQKLAIPLIAVILLLNAKKSSRDLFFARFLLDFCLVDPDGDIGRG